METAMFFVDVGDGHVSSVQAGFAFLVVIEAVDAFELDRAERVDQQSEHTAAADGRELQRVADERDPPSLDELCCRNAAATIP